MACLVLRSLLRRPTCAFPQFSRGIVIPPDAGEPTRTNQEVIQSLQEAVIGGPHVYNPEEFQRQRLKLQEITLELPKSQEDMVPRHMKDSFDHSIIPIGSDLKLRDKYLTHMGGIRIGRLLEDMDIFAAHIVFKHVLLPGQVLDQEQSPISIVTALLDRIYVDKPIKVDEDLKLLGHVTWVGRSSAESTLELHQYCSESKSWNPMMEARFVFVARDALNRGSALINPLVPTNEAEQNLFDLGQQHYMHRKNKEKDSLFKNPPSEEEKEIIHDFFIETVDHAALSFKARVKPEQSVWMEDAKLKKVIICQPENRNKFNKIFGGFIMRQAFELGWALAYVYADKRRPFIACMDDILFERPVEIGSLLYFNSIVAYTQDNYIQVRVGAEALNPDTRTVQTTNVFQFTFFLKGGPAPRVIPKTYHEAMMYLNARRHFMACSSEKELQNN